MKVFYMLKTLFLNSLKYGTTEKEYIRIWGIKHPSNIVKLIIQNALNYLSSFLLHIHMGVQRVKTDKKDSYLIAQYASKFTNELPLSKIPEKELLQIKLLTAHRERVLKHKLVIVKVIKELENTMEKALIISIIRDNKKHLKLLEDQLGQVESKIHELVKENSYLDKNYKLMQSIPGVGPQIALYVMLYTHNFDRITTPRKFGVLQG